jgi:hypothetical protein
MPVWLFRSSAIALSVIAFPLAWQHAQAQAAPAPQDHHGWRGPGSEPVAATQTLEIGGAAIQVDFAAGELDLPQSKILPWIERAASAVTLYYGKFPVPKVRILIVPVAGQSGVLQGTTWGNMRGFPSFTRMRIGQHTTVQDLADDWTMTHELVHSAFPSLPDNQHWMEEGLATYIEPIARVQTGELKASQVWADMVAGMPKGEPAPGDQGMDRTHTWGRTYWGGALFCLVADVEIRRATKNQKSLQDALRAIVAAGGTIDQDGTLPQAFAAGDKATGTTVLSDMYSKWSQSPAPVDLPAIWKGLGVESHAGSVEFNPKAPLANIRESITAAPSNPPQVRP